MRILLTAMIAAACLLTCGLAVQAQEHQQWNIGLAGGASLGVSEGHETAPGFSSRLFLRHMLAQQFSAEFGVGYTAFNDEGGYLGSFDVKTNTIPLDLRLLFHPVHGETWYPYLYAGVGAMIFDVDEKPLWADPAADTSSLVLTVPVGGGVKVNVAENIGLDFQIGNTLSLGDDLNPAYDDVNDAVWTFHVGVTYDFGGPLEKSDEVVVGYKMDSIGYGIILEGITFETGSAKITPSSERILRRALRTLQDNPELEVEIQGHTDSVGAEDMNLKLSLDRANAVKDWLVARGIEANRLNTTGLGESRSVAPNATAEGRRKNRRIEMIRVR